jgi:hypothetical protein
MSAAVQTLVELASAAKDLLVDEGYALTALKVEQAIAAVEAELAATPQQQHEQALARGADEDLTMGR